MNRMMDRHPLSAVWGDLPSGELVAMRESVEEHGFVDPVVWTYGGSVLDGWHRYMIANILGLELEVREYDGDPVPFVIARNRHRRHLNELQRASCVSACLEWAKQGQQKRLDRDEDTGHFTIQTDSVCMGDTTPQTGAEQDGEEPFFTRTERAALADVSKSTQREADRYEKAGLGPQVRSGEISGAEAERKVRKVRDPDAPKPLSQVQKLKMKLEAKTLEWEAELAANEVLRREVREAKAQVSEYPHEREAVASEREVVISAQASSIAELQAKLNDEKRRASWFKKQAETLGWKPTDVVQQEMLEATE